jgi:hypothetical protein
VCSSDLVDGLFVYFAYVGNKVIGSNNKIYFDNVENVVKEKQSVQSAHTIRIEAMSKNDDARTKKEQIIMALSSQYAQRQCDLNSIRIAEIPSSFIDASGAEGGSQLNRYSIDIVVFATQVNEKVMTGDYYDTFRQEQITTNI